MIRAVLFDVDDTLTDYAGAERAGILRYLERLGLPPSRLPSAADTWRELQEHHFARYVAGELSFAEQRRARVVDMHSWLGAPCGDPDAWFDGYRACYEAALAPYADVARCLEQLRDLALGVISNNDEAYTRKKLSLTGLLDRFDCVIGRDTFGCAKPDPEIFHAGCAALSVPPAQTLYVGDHLTMDARGATAAGLLGVWLDRTGGGADGLDVPYVTSLAELPALIEESAL